jgi:lipopolysaccharide transport system permease protein
LISVGPLKLLALSDSRELMVNLTLRELRGKYKRSVLGWTWSLLNPLATMLIFTFVFVVIFKVETPRGEPSGLRNFPLFLLSGLVLWNFVSNSVNGSMTTLIANATLVKKVYFRREVLVAAVIASWLVSMVIEMVVLAVVLMVMGNFVLPWLIPAAVVVVLTAIFVAGLGLVLSVSNVYFRDIQHLVGGVVMQLWFYATPVIYPLSLVPERREVWGVDVPIKALYNLNPMVRYVEAIRDCLYHLRLPSPTTTLYMVVVSTATLALGILVFARLEPKLAEEL